MKEKITDLGNGYLMVECLNGTKYWLFNGNFHRENDLPAIENSNGEKHWYLNGKLHRENGLPAMEYPDGLKYWYLDGERHRENGPAVEFPDGGKNGFFMIKNLLKERESKRCQ